MYFQFFVIPRQNMSDFIDKIFSLIYRTDPVNPTKLANAKKLLASRWT